MGDMLPCIAQCIPRMRNFAKYITFMQICAQAWHMINEPTIEFW
jgi:hypothetical protein